MVAVHGCHVRFPDLCRGRVTFTTLALARYGFRSRDIATLIDKHGCSITRWLKLGLENERQDEDLRKHPDALDHAIATYGRS